MGLPPVLTWGSLKGEKATVVFSKQSQSLKEKHRQRQYHMQGSGKHHTKIVSWDLGFSLWLLLLGHTSRPAITLPQKMQSPKLTLVIPPVLGTRIPHDGNSTQHLTFWYKLAVADLLAGCEIRVSQTRLRGLHGVVAPFWRSPGGESGTCIHLTPLLTVFTSQEEEMCLWVKWPAL